MSPKYSIILPVRNGLTYLPTCLETILNQDYHDYELIISDDHSTDGSKEYLGKLKHPNIAILEPPLEMSMTEHWEWALSHASGMWQIFVGQDDGLQPYFFQLADKLTRIAAEKNIRTIMSQRAYFFWPGCEAAYGDTTVLYLALNKIKILSSSFQAAKALLGFQDYFELPEMYTTSLFHKSILDEAKAKQQGHVLTCHPQDANLGVVAVSLEKKYLKSFIPLGWVGSSPKSAGMAIALREDGPREDDLESLREEYTQKIKKSKLKYNELAGDFSFGDPSLYFWQAFLATPRLRSAKVNRILVSKVFKYLLFSSVQVRLWVGTFSKNKQSQFNHILIKNTNSLLITKVLAMVGLLVMGVSKCLSLFTRVGRRVFRIVFRTPFVKLYISNKNAITMQVASEIVKQRWEQDLQNDPIDDS